MLQPQPWTWPQMSPLSLLLNQNIEKQEVYNSALQSFAFRDQAVQVLKSSDFLQISSSDASAPRPCQCLFCLSCLWVNVRKQPLLIGRFLAIRAGREMASEARSQRPGRCVRGEGRPPSSSRAHKQQGLPRCQTTPRVCTAVPLHYHPLRCWDFSPSFQAISVSFTCLGS